MVTTAVLDRETTSGYLLSVTAKDNGRRTSRAKMQALLNYAVSMECSFQFFNFLGTPQLSDTTDVEITVTDVNDNPPKFAQEGYTVAVSEDVPIGTSIIQVFQIAILLNSF